MMTPAEYFELAEQFGRAADSAPNPIARSKLQKLADSYKVLGKSTAVLNRSTKALAELERTRKKTVTLT